MRTFVTEQYEKSRSQKYIDKLCDEYIAKHIKEQERDELIYENNIEKRDIKGYHGREILELLQNADDAYQKSINEGNKPECELEVSIVYKNNRLTISNTGTFFDFDGIKAIVQGNNSSKSGKYIGNKGTGFRSLLNWADEIRIYSGEFNVKFSKAIAEKKFQEIKSENQIKKQLEKQPNLYIPILAVPQNIEPYKKYEVTSIEVDINPEKLQDGFGVMEQINNIDLRILLFLPNISKILIDTDERQIVYKREIIKDQFNKIVLKKYIDHEIQVEESFYVFEKIIKSAFKEDGYKKDIHLAIAVPENIESFEQGKVYSYFPLLDVDSPFNCVMHASYILGDHRDTISRHETNKLIIIEQLKFLVEVGLKFASSQFGDRAVRLLTPINFRNLRWKFPPAFSQFASLEEIYLKMIEDSKIFRTVNNEYISVKDNPKMFDDDYPHFFVGEKFKNLLKSLPGESINLIKTLANRVNQSLIFEKDELLPIINSLTNDLIPVQRVEVFSWWNQIYDYLLPNLLKKQNGEWLECGEECYFLVGDFSEKDIPTWVKVPALDEQYQQLLFKQAEEISEIIKAKENEKDTHISRLISQKNIFPLVKFTYRDSSNIITMVNSSVDSYYKSIDFVKWLWRNYSKENEDWMPPKGTEQSPIKYKLPSAKDKTVQDGKKLYFGKAYGNDLSEKLFDQTYKEFPSPDIFSVSNKKIKSFVDFISKFGVKRYPVIEKQEVSPLDLYATHYEKIIKETGDIGSSNSIYVRYKLPFILNLEDKLKSLTTLDVLSWIHEDYSLRSYLYNPFYSNNAEITYLGNLQQNFRTYHGQIRNYLLLIFNEVKWFEIGGKKYAPKQIIKEMSSRNNQKFSDLVPILDIKFIQDIAYNLKADYNQILEIIGLFDFCEKVTDLNSEDFYGLMLKLPNYDFQKSIDLSKSIYRIIEQANFTPKYEDSENKHKFFSDGKVLVQYKGKLQYYSAKESYLPSTKIISKKNVPIVEKGQRTNNDNFMKTFGCLQYNKEYTIQKESISDSKSNPSFQQYFSEFLKYARAYGEQNENIERDLPKLSITLVDKITIIENNQAVEILDEYMCIRESATNWYITVFESEFEINQISEALESIFSNIANTPGFDSGKLGELFRARKISDREFLIKKEFGSLEVISDQSYKNAIGNNFIETAKKINTAYSIDQIDIDFENFSSEENCEKLIRLLIDLKIDVDQFKDAGFVYTINLIPYFKTQLMKFINEEKRRFKNNLYSQALTDEKLQDSFLYVVRKFESFEIDNYTNSIYFSVEDEVKEAFGNWEDEDLEIVDSEIEYAKNYELLNPNRLFEDEISNNLRLQQMIYFKNTNGFKAWLDEHQAAQQSNGNKTDDMYSELRDVIPQKEELKFRDSGRNKDNHKHRANGTYTSSAAERRNRNQKVMGNRGELVIYNLLCDQHGKENVFPKSEAFIELEILKPGQASSGQYDISYKDASGTEFFVEVKTSDGHSFIITPSELNFAKQNPKQFKLFLVYDIYSHPKYMELPKEFWKDKKFRKTEIIERIEFEF